MAMATKLGRILAYLDGLLPIKSHDPLIFQDHVTKYLHYHNAYGHQTWQDGDLLLEAANNKVTERSDHVVVQSHLTNENHCISTSKVLMTTILDRMIIYFDGLLPVKSHDPLITWLCEIT